MGMRMACPCHRVTAVEIQIFLTFAGIEPDPRTPLGNDRHLLISRELKALFRFSDFFQFFSVSVHITQKLSNLGVRKVGLPRQAARVKRSNPSGGKPTFPTMRL